MTCSDSTSSTTIVHYLPGRVRILVPGLKGSRKTAVYIADKLKNTEGVYNAEANPRTGRVLVLFNENHLTKDCLVQVINKLRTQDIVVQKRQNHRKIEEPEDLPIKKQLFNVVLGGGVLAYLSLKHLLFRRTPLAKNSYIFGLNAAAALISGYPLLKSGLQSLGRGRINHDLLISTLAVSAILARESIPGLLVIWLSNLTALGQSLVFKYYKEALSEMPGMQHSPIPGDKETGLSSWSEAGQEYAHKALLPTLGMASLVGATSGTGGFQKALAMLLAANPSPAGLAAPTAATAVMARGAKEGVFYRDAQTVEKISKVDTIIFDGTSSLPGASYQLGDILPMPGMSRDTLLKLAEKASQKNGDFYTSLLKSVLTARGSPAKDTPEDLEVTAGDEEKLNAAGIETKLGYFKQRRLQHMEQLPIYIAVNGVLAGLIGIKQVNAEEIFTFTGRLRSLGINNIVLMTDIKNKALVQRARELGIHHVWSGLTTPEKIERVKNLKLQGHNTAIVLGSSSDSRLAAETDIRIGHASSRGIMPDLLVYNHRLLPEAFRLALKGEQRAKQNVLITQAANALGLSLGAAGRLPPMRATVYNNLTSLALGINSLRLLAARVSPAASVNNSITAAQQEIAAALNLASRQTDSSSKHCPDINFNRWHQLAVTEMMQKLKTHAEKGLTGKEVQKRLNFFGPNKLREQKKRSFWSRIWDQLKDFLVKALMASSVICALMGELGDALAIVTILAINSLLGALQEQKAEDAINSLHKITAPTAKVKRDGKIQRIPAAELVPGDIVLLEQGDGVPADLRLLEAHQLEIEESALTGESYPAAKSAVQITDCIPLLDCHNLAFMGTNVTRGRGIGAVVGTGMSTQIGKIAGMLNSQAQETTPLQKRMTEVGSKLLKYSLAASGLVVAAGALRGISLFHMFLSGVSLAVAAIPEGLPAVVTLALAAGVKRMARENAVIRKLPAVETLGSATLICTDKTGTLTQNRQHVQSVYTGSGWWHAGSNTGKLTAAGASSGDLLSLLTASSLCNDASLTWSRCRDRLEWQVEGDPTEGALLAAARQQEINYQELRSRWKRIKEMPFDADRLMMTVICRSDEHEYMAFVKGAPEVVIRHCTYMQQNGQRIMLNYRMHRQFLIANKIMTEKGLRVLAAAYRPLDSSEIEDPEESLILLGLVGMVDPPRQEAKKAVETCHRAGIKVAMITGDHPDTALAIAKQVGITASGKVLTGRDIEKLDDTELAAAVSDTRVFARVMPEHKMRLVKAFRRRGEIIAMVGDGINDAPAVKEADIGVAMGRTGTDVTKQAADIVLTDDNFATLVSAVKQGRGIYSNIKRSVRYLLATNVGEVTLVFLSVLLGLPMPLLPIQLLFLNLLGDGLPALALGVEPPDEKVMDRPPRPADESFFANGFSTEIITSGISLGIISMAVYFTALKQGNLKRARTISLTALSLSQLISALNSSHRRNNRFLTASVGISAALLAAAVYLPLGRRIFKTVPLGIYDLLLVAGTSALTWAAEKNCQNLISAQKKGCR